MNSPALAVRATVLQAPTPWSLEVLSDVVVSVSATGTIEAVDAADSDRARHALATAASTVVLGDDQRLLPGLVDLHVHAPQWPQLGTGLDVSLERWLFQYTFALEARYRDTAFAESVWAAMVPTLLAHGTTTAVYFATTHVEATTALASACLAAGQRAYVGRVAMDHPDHTPPDYRDPDAEQGVAASAASIRAIGALHDPMGLVAPIITPRFIPACSDDLLGGLGDLAAHTGVTVQTHCSESDWEHLEVLRRHGRRDAHSLDHFGLLVAHTVLAHGTHLDDADMDLLTARGAGVAHCPLSNAYFAGAVFPTARALARKVRVGLGSDVAGGSHPGLFTQCAMAVTASRLLGDGVDVTLPADRRGVVGARIDAVTAFHLATAGGAAVLGAPVGLLEPGRAFDAIAVDLAREGSALRRWDDFDDETRVLEKIVRLATPADLSAVWVAGRVVSR
jgi:guanine deaminase